MINEINISTVMLYKYDKSNKYINCFVIYINMINEMNISTVMLYKYDKWNKYINSYYNDNNYNYNDNYIHSFSLLPPFGD